MLGGTEISPYLKFRPNRFYRTLKNVDELRGDGLLVPREIHVNGPETPCETTLSQSRHGVKGETLWQPDSDDLLTTADCGWKDDFVAFTVEWDREVSPWPVGVSLPLENHFTHRPYSSRNLCPCQDTSIFTLPKSHYHPVSFGTKRFWGIAEEGMTLQTSWSILSSRTVPSSVSKLRHSETTKPFERDVCLLRSPSEPGTGRVVILVTD